MASRAGRRRGGSAALAPIRRWVLYSPARLTITVLAILVLCVVVGRLLPDKPAGGLAADIAAGQPSTTARIVKAGDEVTADEAKAVDDDQARKSPQLIAMKYALAYIDLDTTTGEWINALSAYTAPGAVSGEVITNRPAVPVAVKGLTSSASGGKLVVVPTTSGDMSIALTASAEGWQVNTPLPTLGLPPITDTAPTTTETPSPAAAPPPSTTPSVTDASTAVPTPPSETKTPTTPTATPLPPPAPGPIPIPDLAGPLPGRR